MSARVWITGIGVVSAAGNDREATWTAVLAGRPPRSDAGPIEPDVVRPLLRRRSHLKLMADDARSALVACAEALASAGLERGRRTRSLPLWIGVGVDSVALTSQVDTVGMLVDEGGMRRRVTLFGVFRGYEFVNPIEAIRPQANMHAAHLSIAFGLDGAVTLIAPGPSLTATPLIDAARAVASGATRIALVGAADGTVNVGALELLCRLGIDTDGDERTGSGSLRPAPAACFLVLEAAASARRRGRVAFAEILGVGEAAAEAGRDGRESAIAAALEDASLGVGDLDSVHLDALSGGGIAPEAEALGALGAAASGPLAAFSARTSCGYAMAAAPCLDVAVTALALARRRVPPLPRRWRALLPPSLEAAPRVPQRTLVSHHWRAESSTALVLGACS